MKSERRASQRVGVGYRMPRRLSLTFAMLPILLCGLTQRLPGGAADSPSAVTSSPPPRQEDAKRSFLERYAQASDRLKAGLSRLHGKTRFREFRTREPGEWTTFEFFIDASSAESVGKFWLREGAKVVI